MALKDLIKSDWQKFDGVEDVTLTRKHPSGAAVPAVKALRRQLSIGQRTYLGGTLGLTPRSCVWHLWEDPALEAAGAKVSVDDTITDASGQVWIILDLTYSHMTSRYRTICNPTRP